MALDEMSAEESVVLESTQSQLRYFPEADPRCRAMQLPEGVLLRYTLAQALYFYLRTGVAEGKIATRVYASDSPYDRMKTDIGLVSTPMFEQEADARHLRKLKRLLGEWVEFVKEEPSLDQPFTSFSIDEQRS